MVAKQVSRNILKISQALGFLLMLDDNHKMDRVKLMKILWAADRLHLRRYGRTITDSEYYAMLHGPVCSLALDIARMDKDGFVLSATDKEYLEEYFTSDDISTSMQKDIGDDLLSESDKVALEQAWKMFKDVDTFDLSDDISHRYPEWAKFRRFFAVNSGRMKIDLEDFFKNPVSDDYFAEDDDLLEAAHGLYKEQKAAKNELAEMLGVGV